MWPPYELEHAFQNGRLSRWEFFTRFSALGMVATSGLLSVMPAWADTPKKGGRLRLGVAGGSTSDALDPATITDTMATNLSFGPLRNNLVEVIRPSCQAAKNNAFASPGPSPLNPISSFVMR